MEESEGPPTTHFCTARHGGFLRKLRVPGETTIIGLLIVTTLVFDAVLVLLLVK